MTPFHLRRRSLLVGVSAFAALTLGACHQVSPTTATTVAAPMVVGESSPDAIARARADSVRYPYTAADVRFMTGMIGHHAQAIEMSKWAPTHGASATLRILAARIINAQQDEIAIMQRWLRDRRQPVPEITPTASMAGMDHNMPGMSMSAMSHALMPGMLTPQQMQALDKSRGEDFDRAFLTFMIQHHEGATSMVKELFATDGAGQDEVIFKFASDVNVDQSTEIARMKKMLFALQLERPSK